MSDTKVLQEILASCQRTEAKIDTLVAALAEDDEAPLQRTLEGGQAGRERDQTQSLDPSDPK